MRGGSGGLRPNLAELEGPDLWPVLMIRAKCHGESSSSCPRLEHASAVLFSDVQYDVMHHAAHLIF